MSIIGNSTFPPINPNINPNVTSLSKVTVAPPIPTYYKQNINNYVSSLPALSYQNPQNVAKTFSQKFNQLKEIEDKLQNNNISQSQQMQNWKLSQENFLQLFGLFSLLLV